MTRSPFQPRPCWRGFSFALHLMGVQGFYFFLLQYSQIQAFTTAFLPSMQFIQPTTQNSAQGFTGAFPEICPIPPPRYQTGKSGYNTTCATLERITAPQHLQHIPDTSVTPGRCTAQHSRPIIIRYIRMQRPRKPGGVSSTDPAQLLRGQRLHLYRVSQAGSRCFPHLALAWHRVSLALAWRCAFFLERRRGTIDGYRRISFRAFAR